jgi:hypothetical protein
MAVRKMILILLFLRRVENSLFITKMIFFNNYLYWPFFPAHFRLALQVEEDLTLMVGSTSLKENYLLGNVHQHNSTHGGFDFTQGELPVGECSSAQQQSTGLDPLHQLREKKKNEYVPNAVVPMEACHVPTDV